MFGSMISKTRSFPLYENRYDILGGQKSFINICRKSGYWKTFCQCDLTENTWLSRESKTQNLDSTRLKWVDLICLRSTSICYKLSSSIDQMLISTRTSAEVIANPKTKIVLSQSNWRTYISCQGANHLNLNKGNKIIFPKQDLCDHQQSQCYNIYLIIQWNHTL